MRSIMFPLGLLGALAASGGAAADPVLECRVLTSEDATVDDCLRTQLEVSYRAMNDALDLARAAAQELDRITGGERAILAVESSQHAWEAYRDVECQTTALFAGGGGADEAVQLACDIEFTRARTEGLLHWAYQVGAPRAGDDVGEPGVR